MRRLLFGLVALLAIASPVKAEEPAFVSFGAGYYDLFDDEAAGEARLEYRFSEAQKLFFFSPFVGFTATTDAATYGYAGVGIDVFFGRRLVVTPNFAVGIYGDGDGKDLGHAIEFRSGVEVAYRFDDYSRLGLSFTHISNAGLDERNPGVESLVLMYSVPFNKLFAD